MSVTILEKEYNIENTKKLDLSYSKYISLPSEIGNLTNLKDLDQRRIQMGRY
jgi:Leucine-rich repeat (LRR) protein